MPKNWFKGLMGSLNRRVAERYESPGVVAYYWDGGPPEARPVRNISSAGLYLETEDGLYPGTLVRLTLQKTDSAGKGSEDVVVIRGKAVRSGPDGVGLVLILPERRTRLVADLSDREDFNRFLQLLKEKRSSEPKEQPK